MLVVYICLLLGALVYLVHQMGKMMTGRRVNYYTVEVRNKVAGPTDLVSMELYGGPRDGQTFTCQRKDAWYGMVEADGGQYLPMKDFHLRPVCSEAGAYLMEWIPAHVSRS